MLIKIIKVQSKETHLTLFKLAFPKLISQFDNVPAKF